VAIQKKSLISNRTATKKALVAKPEVSKTGVTRVNAHQSKIALRVAPRPAVAFRVASPSAKVTFRVAGKP